MRIRANPWVCGIFFTSSLLAQATQPTYSLSVSANEVTLSFHASDVHGLPINDLKLADLQILDNGLAPVRISDFQLLRDIPLRVGIVFDTSVSMAAVLDRNREIGLAYTQTILRQSTDQAFVLSFGNVSKLIRPWTSDSSALALSLRRISGYGERTRPGTAIYDSLHQACHSQFGGTDKASTSNFILLFSDGEDNASRFSLSQAVQACQHTHTAIYAFRAESALGATALAEIAEKTGGQVFHYPENSTTSRWNVDADLRLIEAAQRNQYQLVYVPTAFSRDGAIS
jgi:Ca-activated chloride channel homolog